MKYTSPVLTSAWTAITAIFGAARRSKVGTIGASRRLRVRAAMWRLLGAVESAGLIVCGPRIQGFDKQNMTTKIVVSTFFVKTRFLYFPCWSEYNTLRHRAFDPR